MLTAALLDRVSERDIGSHLWAAAKFDKETQLVRDPIAIADAKWVDRIALRDVIRDRAFRGSSPSGRVVQRYPKGFDRDRYRLLSSMDLLDQLAFRALVSPLVAPVERALSSSVVAHRFVGEAAGWNQRPVYEGWKDRRARLMPVFAADPSLFLLVMDVKNYYASLSIETLRVSLSSLGIDDFCWRPAMDFLECFEGLPGSVAGVPIGPEASGVLGAVGLTAIDRGLRDKQFARMVDDVWVVATSRSQALSEAEHTSMQMRLLGLAPNDSKTMVLNATEALALISDAGTSYMTRGGRVVGESEALATLFSAISEQNESRFRFALGALSRINSPAAVPVLLGDLDLIDVDPRATGRYLHRVTPLLTERCVGLMIDHVAASGDDHLIPGQQSMALALGSRPLSTAQADRLLAAAVNSSERKRRGVCSAAIVAAGRAPNSDRRLESAMDYAESIDDLDLRRAVACGLKRHSRPKTKRAAWTQLCRIDHEIRPFVRPLLGC